MMQECASWGFAPNPIKGLSSLKTLFLFENFSFEKFKNKGDFKGRQPCVPFVAQESTIGRVQSAKNRSLQSGVVLLHTTHFAAIDFWQLSIPSNSRFLSYERYDGVWGEAPRETRR